MTHTYATDLNLYIDGERLGAAGRATHRVINPATGATLGELPLATAADLDRALDTAARGYRRMARARPPPSAAACSLARRSCCESASRRSPPSSRSRKASLCPKREGEVMMAANLFDFYAGEVYRVYGRVLVRPAGTLSRVMKEPVGPVAAFCPWNFPIGNPARKLGAAIGAGCSIILKPAEEAPAFGARSAELLAGCGIARKRWRTCVFGVPDQVSRHLLASPIIRKVSFTGLGRRRQASDEARRGRREAHHHGARRSRAGLGFRRC